MAILPPGKKPFVDREEQIEQFEELLQCAGGARVMVITQLTKFGKSELLRKLSSRCAPPVLVSLVDADPDKGRAQDPFHFVLAVKTDLESAGMSFAETNLEMDRLLAAGIVINLSGANLGQAHNFSIKGVEGDGPPPPPMTTEQREYVLNRAFVAFFNELIAHSQQRTIALLIDAFEKWKPDTDIYVWFHRSFLKRLFFAAPADPPRVILIVAGQTMPVFDEFPQQLVDARVKRSVLGPWREPHSIDYFRQVMQREPDAIELSLLQAMAQLKLPPGEVASAVDAIRSGQRGS